MRTVPLYEDRGDCFGGEVVVILDKLLPTLLRMDSVSSHYTWWSERTIIFQRKKRPHLALQTDDIAEISTDLIAVAHLVTVRIKHVLTCQWLTIGIHTFIGLGPHLD